MQREYCSGAVLYTEVNNIINYILVVEIDGHCGFPKGHIELGETEIQAALREIKEETGITANILDGFLVKIEYAMKNGNIKQTTYFCAKYKNQTIKYDEHELLGVILLLFDKALLSLTYQNVKDVLIKANQYITCKKT